MASPFYRTNSGTLIYDPTENGPSATAPTPKDVAPIINDNAPTLAMLLNQHGGVPLGTLRTVAPVLASAANHVANIHTLNVRMSDNGADTIKMLNFIKKLSKNSFVEIIIKCIKKTTMAHITSLFEIMDAYSGFDRKKVKALTLTNPHTTINISTLANNLPSLETLTILNPRAHMIMTGPGGNGTIKHLTIDNKNFAQLPDGSDPSLTTHDVTLTSFTFRGNGNIAGTITTDKYTQSVRDNVTTDDAGWPMPLSSLANCPPLPTDKINVKKEFNTFVSFNTHWHKNWHYTPTLSMFDNCITHVVLEPDATRKASSKTRSMYA